MNVVHSKIRLTTPLTRLTPFATPSPWERAGIYLEVSATSIGKGETPKKRGNNSPLPAGEGARRRRAGEGLFHRTVTEISPASRERSNDPRQPVQIAGVDDFAGRV
jgi:hypothetical protein